MHALPLFTSLAARPFGVTPSRPGGSNMALGRRGVQPRRLVRDKGPPAAKTGGTRESRTDLIDEWRRRWIEGWGVDQLAGLGQGLAARGQGAPSGCTPLSARVPGLQTARRSHLREGE